MSDLCAAHRGLFITRLTEHGLDPQSRLGLVAVSRVGPAFAAALRKRGCRVRRWSCPACELNRLHREPCGNADCPGVDVDLSGGFLDGIAKGIAHSLAEARA